MFPHNRPIHCPPRYRVHNRFVHRPQPIIHPVVHVNRLHIVDVPKHIHRPVIRNEIVRHRPPFRCW
ncbi:spore coat protein D [Siminovitchia fortis]|uniref:Spore coat protein D n=1 Tax=Siminovitchia fortis TaxID=254758 RepID=A0A443ING7_9BACI|nr:spore coat protein D [Siminovitchia fortis]